MLACLRPPPTLINRHGLMTASGKPSFAISVIGARQHLGH